MSHLPRTIEEIEGFMSAEPHDYCPATTTKNIKDYLKC